jgi:hypothetical protein
LQASKHPFKLSTMKTIKLGSLILFALVVIGISSSFQSANEPSISLDDEYEVKFRIEICTYENHAPFDKVEALRKIGKVKVIKQEGMAYYYSKPYATAEDATTHLGYFVSAGFENPREVVELENSFVSLDDYYKMINAKEEINTENNGVIRIYKN